MFKFALAGLWIVALLVTASAALSLPILWAAERRLDLELADTLDNLLVNTTVDDQGGLTAPALTDPLALRVHSGHYWSIDTPRGQAWTLIAGSRSLLDFNLRPPAGGVAQVARNNVRPVFYDSVGPDNQALRVGAMQLRLSGYSQPVVFVAAETRGPTGTGPIAVALILAAAFAADALAIALTIATIVSRRRSPIGGR